MRIIAGTARGRKLSAPEGRDVRPTSDKVRGAIFNALQARGVLQGAQVLDVFCGSGALGLEALSRGAAHAAFIDNSKVSIDFAKENAKALGFSDKASFIFSDSEKLKTPPQKFSLVFLDPPYNKNLVLPVLAKLSDGGWLEDDAVCVIEAEKSFKGIIPPPYQTLDEKVYGDTKVLFLCVSR